MDVIFQEPVTVLLFVGVVWKIVDLAHAPHDRVLRLLVACLTLLAAGETLSFPEAISAIDADTAAGVGKMAFNAVFMGGLCALILFFAASTRAAKAGYRRRVRLHTGLLAGVLIAMLLAMLATPPALRDHTLSTPFMAEPAIAGFYVIGNAYFVYAYLASALWAQRYARMAARQLALGLRTVTLGLFLLAVTSVNRVVWVCLRIDEPASFQGFNAVNWSMTDGALGIVVIGMSYSAGVQLVAHLRSVRDHRRMYHALTPLWTALSTAYPELVLNRAPDGPRWDRLRLRHTHERFYRRLIECRDGLVRLSPYLTRIAPEADLASGPPERLARHIDEALALKPTTEDPNAALSAARIAFPSGSDLNADAQELIEISRAYARGHRGQGTDHR
ncbi:MAB_1171c family putative transporter [Streptomyces sp. NPDC048650]|uniref:MAB_1171c family putative transporter n=1 Tax=unclassified Streptomyces TaxID=2593676 RepID=UPI003715968C